MLDEAYQGQWPSNVYFLYEFIVNGQRDTNLLVGNVPWLECVFMQFKRYLTKLSLFKSSPTFQNICQNLNCFPKQQFPTQLNRKLNLSKQLNRNSPKFQNIWKIKLEISRITECKSSTFLWERWKFYRKSGKCSLFYCAASVLYSYFCYSLYLPQCHKHR